MRKHLLINSLIVFLLIGLAAVFTFAYFFIEEEDTFDREVGLVDVKASVYFKQDNGDELPATFVTTINGKLKDQVYYVNVSDMNSPYHINKIRVTFLINSNVETYFRIRLIDTLTLIVNTEDGYKELSTPNVGIEYPIDGIHWYFDKNTNWYYYKEQVKKVNESTMEIPFIVPGLEYDLKAPQYQIQFGIKIEAVQAHLGPVKNWGYEEKPWGGEW